MFHVFEQPVLGVYMYGYIAVNILVIIVYVSNICTYCLGSLVCIIPCSENVYEQLYEHLYAQLYEQPLRSPYEDLNEYLYDEHLSEPREIIAPSSSRAVSFPKSLANKAFRRALRIKHSARLPS